MKHSISHATKKKRLEKCVLTYVCFDSSDDSSCDYINAVKSKKDKCSHENNADSRSDTIKKVKKKKTNRIREDRKKIGMVKINNTLVTTV